MVRLGMLKFDYIRPSSVAEAIALLNDSAYVSRPLAGGTDVLTYLHHYAPNFDRVVDISLLPELKTIRQTGDTISVGAAVTFTEITESELLQKAAPLLVEAAGFVGGPQIRNMGTVGGNVINAAACADSLPVWVCLEAVAYLRGASGERSLPVSQLVVQPKRTQLRAGELLTHFTFTVPPTGVKAAFLKLGRRNAQAISRMTMATLGRVSVNGQIDFIRLTPGATTPQTMRFSEVEAMLFGQVPSIALISAASRQVADSMIAITGRRWSTEYKEPVIMALAERALGRVLL